MNYYPFHIGDFRSGTVNMSRQARWIYRDMMDVYYDVEAPLPLDIDVLCDALGVEAADERVIVERLLRFKFLKTDAGYRHEVCEQVIADYQAKAGTAKANGKKSAATRYQNGRYMPGEGVMYAVRVSPTTVKVGVTANMKSRLHQLRSKYGKQAFVLHQVAVACMGDAEADLLAEYADVRSGEEFPVEVAQEPLLISAMDRIQVAYQVASPSHAGSPNRSHTNQEPITNNQKPLKTKATATPPALPDWIPADAWLAFLAMRKSVKKPITDSAVPLAVSKLDKLRAAGNDPRAVLEQSTLNSWQGLFEVKVDGLARAALPPRASRSTAAMGANAQAFDDPFAKRAAA